MFEFEQHRQILMILRSLDAAFLQHCEAYFGGGTFLALEYGEYRLSRDIDFLCPFGAQYRLLRQSVRDRGYDALFVDQTDFQFSREIQTNQYGIRFPIAIADTTIKFEIVCEGRIKFEQADQPDWSPVACLSTIDCFAEKLLANSDRWLDTSVEARDLIDLAIQRLHAPIPPKAIAKAETAYSVIEPLQQAILAFQSNPEYRDRCYRSLSIRSPQRIVDGLDRLAADFGFAPTLRTIQESA